MEISNVCYYDAKITELKNWKQHNVYRKVPYHGEHLISPRWVCSLINETNAGFVPKAWLVAKGFEDNEKKQCTYRIANHFKRKFMCFNCSFISNKLVIK